MATCRELLQSPSIREAAGSLANSSRRRKYLVLGTSDPDAALAEVKNTAESSYGGLIRGDIELEPVAETSWEATVNYGMEQPGQLGTGGGGGEMIGGLSFQIGTESRHITNAIAQTLKGALITPAATTTIGIAKAGGQPEGCDILVPVATWTEKWYGWSSVCSPAYRAKLRSLVATVNSASWRAANAGEVLFMGAAGALVAPSLWELTYNFAWKPNLVAADDIMWGDIGPIVADGWDYLWANYYQDIDANGFLGPTPQYVMAAQVYKRAAFADLLIGS